MREEYDFSKGIKNPFADDCKINLFFKSVIDQDRAAVVICDLDHVIVYMNPAAERNYEKWGGAKLVGQSLMDCHNGSSRESAISAIDSPQFSSELSRTGSQISIIGPVPTMQASFFNCAKVRKC